MAKVVLIVDSETGKLIDATGTVRENGRYNKFARRMLSSATNPTLDYGVNGGNTLTVSKSGSKGQAINLMAQTVNVSDVLTVGGKTIQQIADESRQVILDDILGTEGEISVDEIFITDSSAGMHKCIQISLDSDILEKISMLYGSTEFEDGYLYAAGNFVFYNNRRYLCKKNTDGSQLPTDTGYWNDVTNMSSLFSSTNLALTAAVDAEIAARCASLNPDKSSVKDVIKALKGVS